ncbi:DUF4954 family protein [Sphingobacterium sp. SGG-5]|uniref:DUF4954 family protein n=1 Tax=Sphingobacterium sp. SGG-5 TaxID=2710881 RepID=UPI0013EA019B|nr:DUF4954 family protein [Sphingobacterium sp. SGG-5]NGM62208.1 DUF4954 family protein [Sphingobacterium sp. SGG-5]
MSTISQGHLQKLGYDFIPPAYLPDGKNEYYLRNTQQKKERSYRNLTPDEIRTLKANNNYCPDWSQVWVSSAFFPDQIFNSKFFGLVRIGMMSPIFLEYRDLRLSCGIYNSQIISSDIGDNACIHHVRYMSHFIIGDEVMLSNINEMETSNNAKFGNGILKDGDPEERRIWLELCNENGGRSVLPFDGLQAADVYLWTRYRQDDILQKRFQDLTESRFSRKRGFYSEIDDQVVLKNANIIKDVRIGACAYIKGVNKLKNVTIHSSREAYTQIGEGCEIVNGVIGYGCRVFYGVKAVRFILSSHSQLKYGARLINSFLGDNSTISCCEVLNSLIFPAHEQHHNNSFLCAALLKGQSNMAAGATIGSNHNSRAADGEVVAGRGFWPGLCVSLKHNSRFASYVLLVKGDFMHELDIRIPFSLVSNDAYKNQLVIVPGYWFLYNMYALMRNTSKFIARDKRQFKNQYLEYDILAPDTVNEMFTALQEIEYAVGKAFAEEGDQDYRALGQDILSQDRDISQREIILHNTEYSNRKVVLAKVRECYIVFQRMIRYYASTLLADHIAAQGTIAHFLQHKDKLKTQRLAFENIGGQLVPSHNVATLISQIKNQTIKSWEEIHLNYHSWSQEYPLMKLRHAVASLEEITQVPLETWNSDFIVSCLQESVETKTWVYQEIYRSRAKDYQNPFKQMLYNSEEEMETVVGKLDDNVFISSQKEELEHYTKKVRTLVYGS